MRWTAEIAGAPTDQESELVAELQAVARKYGADALTFIGRIGRIDLNTDLDKLAEVAEDVQDVAKDVPVPGAAEVAAVAGDVSRAATDAASEVPAVEAEATRVATDVEDVTPASALAAAEAAPDEVVKAEGIFERAEHDVEELFHHNPEAS
jgi:hypothetical protein